MESRVRQDVKPMFRDPRFMPSLIVNPDYFEPFLQQPPGEMKPLETGHTDHEYSLLHHRCPLLHTAFFKLKRLVPIREPHTCQMSVGHFQAVHIETSDIVVKVVTVRDKQKHVSQIDRVVSQLVEHV